MPPDTTILLEALRRAQEDTANAGTASARFIAAMQRLARGEDSRTFVQASVGGIFHNLVERYRRREVNTTFRMPVSCAPAHEDDPSLVPNEPQVAWRTVLSWHEETHGRSDSYQEAVARALDLFNSRLSLEQYRQFCDYRRFGVRGSMGGRYVIEIGSAYNVFEVNLQGEAIVVYCCAPDDNLPPYDAMLAQKLWLENDEQALIGKANHEDPRFYFFHPVPETIVRYLYGSRS